MKSDASLKKFLIMVEDKHKPTSKEIKAFRFKDIKSLYKYGKNFPKLEYLLNLVYIRGVVKGIELKLEKIKNENV